MEAPLEADMGEELFQASEDGGECLDGGGLGFEVEVVTEDGGMFGEEGEDSAVGGGPGEVGSDGVGIDEIDDETTEILEALSGDSGDEDGIRGDGVEDDAGDMVAEEVALVEDGDGGLSMTAYLVEGGADALDLMEDIGVTHVDDVEEEVGVAGLGEGGMERGDEVMGEVADEADGIGEEGAATTVDVPESGAGVEGGEESVFDEGACIREGIHEGGLARVGVADEADGKELAASSDLTIGAILDLDEVFLEGVDAFSDESSVDFELLLAGATGADASLNAFEVAPHGFEPGKGVLELGELDLELGLGGSGARGEDVKDELGTVNDLDAGELLEGSTLGGSEVAIGNDNVGVEGADEVAELSGLSHAQIGGGMGSATTLDELGDNDSAGGASEAFELPEGLLLDAESG